jgi:putative transposase
VACLRKVITEAQRLLELADLRDDRGVVEIVDAGGETIGAARRQR